MMVGLLVLPEVTVGMIEASITRRFSSPWTFSRSLTTACGSLPILQVPTGWKIVVPTSPAPLASSASDCNRSPGSTSSGV